MGRVVTKGCSRKQYNAEIMEISVTFHKEGSDSKIVLENVQKQCEDFLNELVNIGIHPEQIRLEDKGINKRYNDTNISAEKIIYIRTKISIQLCTYICSLIKKYSNDIMYSISYQVENEEIKSQELLQLAVEDSRRQADIIAASLGKSIKDAESVNDEQYIHRNMTKSIAIDNINPEIPEAFSSDTPLSDRTALPTIEKSEEITITWIMG